jgi:hypothetical protein
MPRVRRGSFPHCRISRQAVNVETLWLMLEPVVDPLRGRRKCVCSVSTKWDGRDASSSAWRLDSVGEYTGACETTHNVRERPGQKKSEGRIAAKQDYSALCNSPYGAAQGALGPLHGIARSDAVATDASRPEGKCTTHERPGQTENTPRNRSPNAQL